MKPVYLEDFAYPCKHFGVYEGHGLVSDITFDGDTYFPRIRLMPLFEHPEPRTILRICRAVEEKP